MVIIIHPGTDPVHIRGPEIIQHLPVGENGSIVDTFLIVNAGDLAPLGPGDGIRIFPDFLLAAEKLQNCRIIISVFPLQRHIKPPRLHILTDIAAELALERIQRVLRGKLLHRVLIEQLGMAGSGVFLHDEHHVMQAE